MGQYYRRYALLVWIAGLVVLLDQVTKSWVRSKLAPEEVWIPWLWLEDYLRIVNWKNEGASFGFFSQGGSFFLILGFVVIAAILFYFPKVPFQDWSLRASLALLAGGILGNTIDRVVQGYVTDFLAVGPIYVFNLADLSNLAGVVILLIGIGMEEWQKYSSKPERGKESTPSEKVSTREPPEQ